MNPLHDDTVVEAPVQMPDNMTLQLASHLLDSVHSQIRVADEKIRALFGATALLAAALAFAGQMSDLRSSSAIMTVLLLALRGVLLVAIAFSVASAILALLPRVRLARQQRSLFFFGDVAQTSHDAFLAEFMVLSEQSALRQVLSQVHANAQIVRVKYLWTRRAATGFLAAVITWLMAQLVLLIA